VGEFLVNDSGERTAFESGMVRDTSSGKTDYTLIVDGPMLERWAIHLTKRAVKYSKRNWMQANGPAELERFMESAMRHFLQWFRGDTDEDHASAVFFNVNGAEFVKDKMRESSTAVGSALLGHGVSGGGMEQRPIHENGCGDRGCPEAGRVGGI
jgi:hypothetical protein